MTSQKAFIVLGPMSNPITVSYTHLDVYKRQGLQHMDGETALKFVRFRHDALGDIGRIKRQQQFMNALLQKIFDQAISAKMPLLLKELLQTVQTDLPVEEALKLAMYFKDVSSDNIRFFTLPGKPAVLSGVSYWLGDVNRALAIPVSYTHLDVYKRQIIAMKYL